VPNTPARGPSSKSQPNGRVEYNKSNDNKKKKPEVKKRVIESESEEANERREREGGNECVGATHYK